MMTKRVVLVGGGGHASDVLAAYEAVSRADGMPHPVIGYLADDDSGGHRFANRGIARIGVVKDYRWCGATHHIIALGWPDARRQMSERIQGAADIIVHPTAFIPPAVSIGEGTVVLGLSIVSELARIGRHVYVSHGVLIGHDTVIGDFASLMPGASVSGDVIIGEGATIGANATVLEGLKIGSGAVIGAGAAVIRDVPAGATVVGNPARQL